MQHPTVCSQENGKHIVKYWQWRLCRWDVSVTSYRAGSRFLVKLEKGLVLAARETYRIWLINLLVWWITSSFCAGAAECQDWVLTDARTYVPTNLQRGAGSQGIVRYQATVTRSRGLGFVEWHFFLLEGRLSYNHCMISWCSESAAWSLMSMWRGTAVKDGVID